MHDFAKTLNQGVELQIRAVPGSKSSEIKDVWNGKLRVRIAAPAEDGKANKELIDFLAQFFGVSKSSISIVSGEKSRDKTIVISDLDKGEVLVKLNNSQQFLNF